MTRERLLQLIETYGAWPDRWPEAERDAALGALAEVPEASDRLREAQALDAALDAWALDDARPATGRRIEAWMLAQRGAPPPRRPAGLALPAPLRRPTAWLSGAGLAAACVAGVMVGVQLGSITAVHATDVESAASLMDGSGSVFDAPLDGEKSG